MKISTLTIEMAANVARLRQDMDKAQRTVDSAMGGITKAVGLATAAFGALGVGVAGVNFTQWIRGAINAADETSKLAQKTGLLVKEVAGLQLAFDQAGAGEQFQQSLARLAKEAAGGNEAFKAMGISVRAQDGTLKSTRELIGEVADKFASYRDSAEKTALAQQLFGKAGSDLIPLLNAGAASLAEYDAKAKALGITLDEETAKAAEKFNDDLDLLGRYANAASVSIANNLLPTLVDLTSAFATAAQYGGGLLGTLRLIGKTTYGTEGFQLAKDLDSAREKMDDLAKSRERYLRANSDTSGIDQAMAATAREIEYLKDLQRQQVKYEANDQSLAEARRLGINTLAAAGVAPGIPDSNGGKRGGRSSTSARAAVDKAEADALRARIAAAQSQNAAFDDEFERVEKIREATESRIRSGRELLESIQRETALMGMSNEERARAIALFHLERAGVVKGTEAYEAYAQQIEQALGAQATQRAAMQQVEAQKKAAEDSLREWEKTTGKIEDLLSDALMRGFENGKGFGENLGESLVNLFKTWVAKEIAKAITQAIMAAMAQTRWASFFSGLTGGGGSGSGLVDLATSAYSAYNSAGGASGIAGAASTFSGAAYGTSFGSAQSTALALQELGFSNATIAAYTQTATASSTAAASSASAAAASATAAEASATTATAASAGAGGGSGALAATGWGALIVAAIVSANNLYRAGYDRAALSSAGNRQQVGSFSSTTGMGGGGSSQIYSGSVERLNRSLLDAVGISEKWSDILSGTTRMAATFGRKLAFAGFSVGVNGSNTSVKGVEQYRGGLFRSDKTREFAVDPRDQKMVQDLVAQTRAAALETARAAGLSTDAIETWNGQIAINFKNAKTAAEQTERYNKALTKAYNQMIEAAQKATFDANIAKQVEGVRDSARTMAAALGLSTAQIDSFSGSLNVSMREMDGSEAAARKLAKASDDLYFQMLQSTAGFNMSREKFAEFMQGIVASAEAAGISAKGIADILVQGMTGRLGRAEVGDALASMIVGGIYNAIAQNYANTIAQAFTSQIITPIFTAIASGVPISQAISQQAIKNVVATAQAAAAQLNAVFNDPGFRAAIQGVQQAIQGVSIAATSVRTPMKRASTGIKSVSTAADDARRAAEELRTAWQSVADSLIEEIRRIRGEVANESGQGFAFYTAQFVTATNQARVGDRAAAERLPDLSKSLLDAAALSVKTADELQRIRAWTAQVLQDTASIVGSRYGLNIPAFATGTDFVPRDMLAMVHKGERITPAPFNPANSPENGMAEALDRLASRVDRMATVLTDIESNTDDAARTLKSVTVGEQALKTTT